MIDLTIKKIHELQSYFYTGCKVHFNTCISKLEKIELTISMPMWVNSTVWICEPM